MNIKLKALLLTAGMLVISYLGFQIGAYIFSNYSLSADEFKRLVAVTAVGVLVYVMYTLVLSRLQISEAYEKIEENRN